MYICKIILSITLLYNVQCSSDVLGIIKTNFSYKFIMMCNPCSVFAIAANCKHLISPRRVVNFNNVFLFLFLSLKNKYYMF